jgi:hypothetical protein
LGAVPSLDDLEKKWGKIHNAACNQSCCRWIFGRSLFRQAMGIAVSGGRNPSLENNGCRFFLYDYNFEW